MVTVELEFDEQELLDLLMNEFIKRYSFDDITTELMKNYFERMINDGSSSLFFGPNRIEDYVMGTWDSVSVVDPNDRDYHKARTAWEEKTYDLGDGEVVAEYKKNYLVWWYN